LEVKMNGRNQDPPEYESTIGAQTFLSVLLAMAVGTLAAVVILPSWMPHLATSLLGSDPKAFWYLSRGTSFVAMSLLWVSMALGLGITNKMARAWPGAPAAFAIHEYVSLLGLIFAIFHALVLMGDHYIAFTLAQIVVPFTTVGYKPLFVGLGQLGFYIWLLVALSFYVRSKIGPKTWRAIHYISFVCYCMALYHGITSGTDTKTMWAQTYYWVSGASLLFLLVYRILVSIIAKFSKPPVRAQAVTSTAREGTPTAQ
jgi:predicted ferric reductase